MACLDEVGRGPLAGPVVAAAVVIQNTKDKIQNTKIRDSKKLSAKRREEIYKTLTKSPAIKWGIGKVSEKVIDKINILEATKLAMIRAIKKLERKPDFLIIDGNFKLNLPESQRRVKKRIYPLRLPIPQKSIVKGDEKVFSVALASIIAKVTRDGLMKKYAKKYPHYGFDAHKGYPTKFHFKMLKKYGHCQIHRKSFKPLKKNN